MEDINITPEEYDTYLSELYKNVVLSNPENATSAKKLGDETLTQEEMKSLVMDQIKITNDDLLSLADQRAREVRNAILADGRVEAKRVFIKESVLLSPKKAGKHPASRVELGIE